MFNPVEPQPNFPKLEEAILDFWREKKIFEQVVKKNQGKPSFVFFEGPPTANGKPGLHHIEARAFKDVILRFRSMLGHDIVRKAGWDTHGLPVELQVEKSLGISGKPQIENLVSGDARASIVRFNELCRQSVWKYREDWERFTARMGFWLDMSDPYVTYDSRYIESVWWILRQLWDKHLIYRGHKVVPYCPRCGTALSSHEVAQGYRSVRENSVYIRFKIKADKIEFSRPDGQREVVRLDRPTSILSWTTTPWTLPGNVALAVNEDLAYDLIVAGGEQFIIAHTLAGQVIEGEYTVLETFPGKALAGLHYEPLFEVPELQSPASYRIYTAPFVTDEDGTGVVHTAVMYGEEDYTLGSSLGLPKFHTVSESGEFIASLGELGGLPVKAPETEDAILKHLDRRGGLYRQREYEHDYPFCWRCGTALLYYARDSWFVKMSALREKLRSNNQKINWIPEHIREGRFGEWLAEVKDWAISRERYWGTPLPIWQCGQEGCGNTSVISSFQELADRMIWNSDDSKDIEKWKKEFDPHRPYVDDVKLPCDKAGCAGIMTRVPEVLDVWFDSGAMPFAQWHYPFENKGRIEAGAQATEDPSTHPTQAGFASTSANASADRQDGTPRKTSERQFPADYISEAIDQTRGWFYTLLAISTALGYEHPPYRNVICLGHVLDAKGQKMSKSKGNIVEPDALMNKYGIDAVRWYLYSVNQPGDPKLFTEDDVVRCQRRIQIIFWNVYNYFVTYAGASAWEFSSESSPREAKESPYALDRWITARLQQTINSATENLGAYNVFRAVRDLEVFIDDLSTWYLRRSRGRSDRNFFATLYRTLIYTTKLLAPMMPFFAETVYQNLTVPGYPMSVHLSEWPQRRELTEDERVTLERMSEVRRIVEAALQWRKEKNLKVRQPLRRLAVRREGQGWDEYASILAEELNIRSVIIRPEEPEAGSYTDALTLAGSDKPSLYLDATLDAELRAQGIARDLERLVQDLRKRSGFRVGERVVLYYETASQSIYDAFAYFDQAKTYTDSMIGARHAADCQIETAVEGEKLWIGLKRLG